MTSLSSVAEVMVAERTPFKGGFRSRLAVSSLMTGLDVGILMVVGRAAFQCAPFSWMLPVAFSILGAGALVSLGHMWFLTLQSWNCR
jgi:hypothetical protein